MFFMDLSLNGIRVSEMNAVCQAYIVGTGGDKSVVHPLVTKVALFGCVLLGIKGNGMVRTGIHTKPAAGARFFVQDHNSVIPMHNGFNRATAHAWGIIAVSAYIHLKYTIRFVVSGAEIFFGNLDQFYPFRNIIFLFARHFARFASPAGYMIYDQCVFLHDGAPSRFLGGYPAQKGSNMGGSHGRVAGLVSIICQDINVGFIPAVERIFFFGKPPAMFC
jgi:hypothetical protein